MKANRIRQNVLPVLTALIWGTAFVAQSISAKYLQPFTFNAARSLIAALFLLALSAILRLRRRRDFAKVAQTVPNARKDLIFGGLCCGSALALASFLQQKGIETTTSGKAGFITALYIVIVPILGLFFKKKVPWTVWISVGIAVVGLYCLCIKEGLSIAPGDFYLLLCSLCFSAQILLVDHFVQKVDGVELSCAQFFVVTVLSAAGMMAWESPAWAAIEQCFWPLVYVGVFSSGVAYTLQILAQKGSNPTVVSLLLSLEAVFATIAGALILHDQMSYREYVGCGLMFLAVILAQIPLPQRRGERESSSHELKK